MRVHRALRFPLTLTLPQWGRGKSSGTPFALFSDQAGKAGDHAGAVKAISERVLDGLGAVGPTDFCHERLGTFAQHGGDAGGAPLRTAGPGSARVPVADVPGLPLSPG